MKENIPKVVTSAVFACVGTAGQRCTTLRRLIVHEDLYDEVNSGPYWHVPINPHNSPIHPLEFLSPQNINFSIHHRKVLEKLKKSYASIMGRLGDPLDDGTLYGPLHSKVINNRNTILHLFLAAFVF